MQPWSIWLTHMVLYGVKSLPVKLPTHKWQTHWTMLYIKQIICQGEHMGGVYGYSAMWWVCKCLDLTAN